MNADTTIKTIIDVRTPEEFEAGHVAGSINVPLDIFPENLEQYNFTPDAEIVICCESGGRSAYAVHILKELGFTCVKNGGSWRGL